MNKKVRTVVTWATLIVMVVGVACSIIALT